jgi:[NiFe] hydrogenase large subunit
MSNSNDTIGTISSQETATEPTTGSATIVLDPITRIEGHLRIETEVSGGSVVKAWSIGTLFRGIEPILKNRDPRDAWMFTQRLCGVCTYVHGIASVRSVEDALGVTIPDQARLIRNLLMGAQWVHDHIVHFYQLHALDWVDVVSALNADPTQAAAVDRQICSGRNRNADYFSAVLERLKAFAGSGQLGPFANGYWGHPAYILSPEENLVFMADYLEALRLQISAAHMHAILAGKNPHPHGMIVGGVPLNKDLTAARISEFANHVTEAGNFVRTRYLPDATWLAYRYKEYAAIGGCDNLLTYGEFPQSAEEPASCLFRRGTIFNRQTGVVQPVDMADISEHVTRSWYSGGERHPSEGQTVPQYTGLDTSGKYSWVKAPRYMDLPMEVGPLARVMVNYGTGHQSTVDAVNGFLQKTGLRLADMYSSLGRTAARAIETGIIAEALAAWTAQLSPSPQNFEMPFRTIFTMQDSGSGAGLNDAPRGALGHWLNFSGGKITNFQMVVPSTWNFGPRDASGTPGPVEQALVDTPVADQARPLEVLRVVHSFDPCLACAIHVLDPKENRGFQIKHNQNQ